MFILQAFKPGNAFWKYLVGSAIIIGASFVGQIPLIVAIFAKVMTDGGTIPATQVAMMNFLDLNLTLFLMLLSFAFALVAIIIVVQRIHHQKFKEIITSRPGIDWKKVFFSFAIWGLFSVATVFITYYAAPEKFVLQFQPGKFLILFIVATLMVPIQTSVEELVFRGYLMQGFGLLAKNRWFPLVLTSVIFGSMHMFNPEVEKMGFVLLVYYIGTGFFLGIVTLMDEGLELSLGFHAANNLIGCLLVTSDWSALQTASVFKDISEPSAGLDIILPVVIVFPILLFIFSKKYGWTDWKGKLTGKVEPELYKPINEIGQ
jgi:membrane protease YdiL (CAAX protease family)